MHILCIFHMKRNILSLIFICALSNILAQNTKVRWAKGTIADLVTLTPIEGFTSIQLLRCDSVVSEGYASIVKDKGKSKSQFRLPVVGGDFLLRISNENYKVYQDSLHIVIRKREKEIDLGRILLKRRMSDKPIDLAEVEVKASRIKFYFDKDTLIYNAAAFTTQKGFVLTDILNKMPGIEIKSNGDIFSNGKKIEELLVNGKNFFNRDRKTILENLPAFSVSNVKVYEKMKDSAAVIKRDREVEGLVMDIQLKREYAKSSFVNGVAAYGTDNRYYEKLFGMKFHSLYRFSGYANTNNINYNENFSADGVGKNMDDGSGDKKTSIAGFSYDIDNSQGKYSLEGNTKFSYTDVFDSRTTDVRQFFTSGDINRSSKMMGNNYSTKVATDHKLYLFGNTKYDFTIKPTLTYSYNKGNSFTTDSTENINNIIRNSLGERKSWEGNLTIDKTWHAKHSSDYFQTSVTAYFADNSSHNFNDYKLRTRNNQNEWKNQYIDNGLNQKQWHAYGMYHYALGSYTGVEATYTYDNINTQRHNEFYLLHNLPEWNEAIKLGTLPDGDRLFEVIDGTNSSWTKERENNHRLALSYKYRKMNTKSDASEFYIGLPLKIMDKSLRYKNLSMDTTVCKTTLLPNVVINAAKSIRGKGHSRYFFRLTYNFYQSMPSMRSLINVRNDATPLFVTEGNPNLKNSTTNSIDGSIQLQPQSFGNHNLTFSYQNVANEVTQSLLYDKATGVSKLKPININGNNYWRCGMTNSFYIGKEYSTTLKNSIVGEFTKSARMIGTNDDGEVKKSSIKNNRITEEIEFKSRMWNGRLGIILKPYYTLTHTSSSRSGFKSFSTHDFGCNSNFNIELPADIRLKSDFKGTFRRGYLMSELNEHELLWNMNLSKSFSHITLSLSVNDILNDRNNIYKSVNAEKRTEQSYNSVGRYILFSFGWNFSKGK